MNIDGVKNGIILDHIKAGESMRIYNLLGLDKLKKIHLNYQRNQERHNL